ncbi:MAG TPA: MarR family transcriptional regulator [Bacillales bacterium]|nr:MarR family transcriptional regulator [Bacillales bacterium]
MDSEKLVQLAREYGDLSFKVNKMGEIIINNELDDVLTLEQDAVLRFIREHQPCTSSDLSKAFYVKKSAVTAIINRLEKKGFIQRIRSNEDRRVVYLKLTEEGESFHQELSERVNQMLSRIISRFDVDEVESFMKTYKKLVDLIEEELKELKGVNQ